MAPGEGFLSLGTSGVVFAATDRLVANPDRTLHAFCHALPGEWHVMSVALTASSALSWLAGVLGQADLDALLGRVEASAADPAWRQHAPVFLPYLTGERTPHNDPDASAMFAGLRPDHGAESLTYAVLEGVAFALKDGLDVVRGAGVELHSCALVGGGSRSRFWAGLLADTLQLPLQRPRGGVLGASLGAGAPGHAGGGAPGASPASARRHRSRMWCSRVPSAPARRPGWRATASSMRSSRCPVPSRGAAPARALECRTVPSRAAGCALPDAAGLGRRRLEPKPCRRAGR